MPDGKPRPERTTPRKEKICKSCGRAFAWRKKWAQDWDVVKYCSDACRGHPFGAAGAARRLVAQGKIVITQHNQIVDRSTTKGPIRLRLR